MQKTIWASKAISSTYPLHPFARLIKTEHVGHGYKRQRISYSNFNRPPFRRTPFVQVGNAVGAVHKESHIRQCTARIEHLINALHTPPKVSATPEVPTPLQPTYLQWNELLTAVDSLLAAAADVRACTALIQKYSNSHEHLELVVQLLAETASLEDALLSNPHVYTSLLPPDPSPTPYPIPHTNFRPKSSSQPNHAAHISSTTLGPTSDGAAFKGLSDNGSNVDGGSGGGDSRIWRMFATLAPRFLREGYHPANPHTAFSMALSREEKAAMITKARRQERWTLCALRRLLDCRGTGDNGETAALLPPPREGRNLSSYEWPSYDLTVEELAEDRVLAEVATAQWQLQRGGEGCEVSSDSVVEDRGGVGGQLELTLDACGSLLQRHPDALLRQQVGLVATGK